MKRFSSQNKKSSDWIASRNSNNFFYSKGAEVTYSSNCNNSLVITNKEQGEILATSGHATIQLGGEYQRISILHMENILEFSKRIFPPQSIIYQKPKSIAKKEQLPYFRKNELKNRLQEEYGLYVKKILNIKTCKGENRVYRVITKNNEDFILKYGGIDDNLLNGQLEIAKNISLFPSIISTKNGNSFVSFKGNRYSLENFIDGTSFQGNERNYFSEIGKKIGELHNKINSFSKGNSELEALLTNESNFLSESNILSGYLDTFIWMGKHHDLTQEYFNLIKDNFCVELNLLPEQIIHGDLNKSNLIWNKDCAKIIDFETMKKNKRIMEFVSPLIFRGNFQTPVYKAGSLSQLMNSYNSVVDKKLTAKEISLLPDLIKSYLLRLHTIRSIRRNERNEYFEKQLKLNFKKLENEK